jgi:hypothetical protein
MDDENATPELWEHQGHGLTVGSLRIALRGLPDNLAVKLSLYDGLGIGSMVDPIEVGLTDAKPEAVVITGSRI